MANPTAYACETRVFMNAFCERLTEFDAEIERLKEAASRYSAMQRPNYGHAGNLDHAIARLREVNWFLRSGNE